MKGPKLLVPAVMRRKMLEKIHYSHVGADSCLRKARDVLFWPGMASGDSKGGPGWAIASLDFWLAPRFCA